MQNDDYGFGYGETRTTSSGQLHSSELHRSDIELAWVNKKLTETDKILEQEVTGAVRLWHIIFIVCAAIIATS